MTFQPTGSAALSHAVRDGALTLTLSGELDLGAEREVRAWIGEHAAAHGGPVVLDLRGVAFADSAGLRALINADAAARQDGWSLRIVIADGQLRQTLAVSGLDGMLPVYVEPE
ncbi:MAG TPA: STAS domain-containing protein [Baekduia sp.]|nr:STAS domain-containing protein [Baekduia sp.]